MRKFNKKTASIGEILNASSTRMGFGDGLKRHKLWTKWNEIVGASIADFAQPVRWRGKTLIVRVAHHSWMQELQFLKPQMMEKIRTALPKETLKEIRFEVGELTEASQRLNTKGRLETRPLGKDEREYIDQAIKEIKDESVRDAARRAMEKGFMSLQTNRK